MDMQHIYHTNACHNATKV